MFSLLKNNILFFYVSHTSCIYDSVGMVMSSIFIYYFFAYSSNFQLWTSSNVHISQGSPDFLGEYLSQDVSKPAQESNSEAQSQPLPSETKSSGRKELPAVIALPCMVSVSPVSQILLMLCIKFSAGPFYWNLFTSSRPNTRLSNLSTLWQGIQHAVLSSCNGMLFAKS